MFVGSELVAGEFFDSLDRHGQNEIEFAYLGLEKKDFKRMLNYFIDVPKTQKPEDVYEEVISYALDNPFWSAKYLLGVDLLPFQLVILDALWNKPFPMIVGNRGSSKSFLLAVYALLRAVLTPGSKIVLIGGAFRQSKIIFEYAASIWDRSAVLQQISRGECPKKQNDGCSLKIGDSIIQGVPLGDGTKIRGLRANYVLVDEYSSVDYDVYQVVVRGFGAVKRDPISSVKLSAVIEKLKEKGIDTRSLDKVDVDWNQIVLAGTAYYQFNHFYADYNRYRKIIENKIVGDSYKHIDILGETVASHIQNLDYKDYAILQIPYTSLPNGYLDERQIAQARATIPKSVFDMEFNSIFQSDSDGFFRRSVLEAATCPVRIEGKDVLFFPTVKGDPNKLYFMGVDPSHGRNDNLSICIIEAGEPKKIVYLTTINRKTSKATVKLDTSVDSIYAAGARKILDLLKSFNVVCINMDAGGGGHAIKSYLQLPEFMRHGDQLIWEIDDMEHVSSPGFHFLKLVNFQSGSWVAQANHQLLRDFESLSLLFPGRIITDITLDDICADIEETKREICCISVEQTKSSREQFVLFDNRDETGVNMKDRYIAVLLANDADIVYHNEILKQQVKYSFEGGRPDMIRKSSSGNQYSPKGTGRGGARIINIKGRRIIF